MRMVNNAISLAYGDDCDRWNTVLPPIFAQKQGNMAARGWQTRTAQSYPLLQAVHKICKTVSDEVDIGIIRQLSLRSFILMIPKVNVPYVLSTNR